jgi:signal transduction histidine kinase
MLGALARSTLGCVPIDLGPRVRWGLRAAGLVATSMVALPIVLHGGLDRVRLAGWSIAVVVFAVCFWTGAGAPARGARALLLAVQVACVVAMVLLLCDGFEGSLLVLVALQLGAVVGWPAGVTLVVGQTALLATAIAVHWSPSPALLLAPPYLGFQLLAFAVARLLVQQTEANAELLAARGVAEENSRLGERLRIARDLHDAVGHRMTALRLHLEAAVRTTEGDAGAACRTAHALAADVLADIRETVARLRDGDGIDLATALRTIAADLPGPPRVHLTSPPALACPDGERALTLLRCAQEIVTNAARHSGARNLWIDVVQGDRTIELSARDDGCGAEVLVAGAGLRGMRERVEGAGGRLELRTSRGSGFSVLASLPTSPP